VKAFEAAMLPISVILQAMLRASECWLLPLLFCCPAALYGGAPAEEAMIKRR